MGKKKQQPAKTKVSQIDEKQLFAQVVEIIENRKTRAATQVNQETTMMFWEVGRYINSIVLGNKRAEYGKQIVTTLSSQLS